MPVVRFPGGGSLSIEFTDQAPDDDQPRLGAWLELRAEDPAAVMRTALDAGLSEVKHPGRPYYVMVPGGQVFTIAPVAAVAARFCCTFTRCIRVVLDASEFMEMSAMNAYYYSAERNILVASLCVLGTFLLT